MKVLRLAGTFASLLKVFAFFLLIPLAASLYWDENLPTNSDVSNQALGLKATTVAFGLTFALVLILGFMISALAGPHVGDLREREALFVVGTAWLWCALLGGIPFLVTHATLDPSIAFFEAMSGLTTTGFSALAGPLEQYPESLHVWRATLQLFGGMGIVLVAVAIVARLTEGGARMMGSEAGGEMERLRPKLSHTARSLFLIYLTVFALSLGAFLVAFRFDAGLDWKSSVYESYVHASAAVATGGFSSHSDSLAAFGSHAVIWVGLVAMFAGGISFPLYFKAVRHGIGVIFRNHEFRFFLGVLAAAFVAVGVFFFLDGRSVGYIVEHGLFFVVTSLVTCGFTSTGVGDLPDGVKLVLLFLMFTGAMVGSTTGAIKLSRIALLLRLTADELRRLLHPRAVTVAKFAGQILPEGAQRRVIVFFFTYVTLFIAGALFFSLLGSDLDSSLVRSAATLGGVGYGWGDAAGGFADPISPWARFGGVLLMWMGRLEIFTVLVLLFPRTYRD